MNKMLIFIIEINFKKIVVILDKNPIVIPTVNFELILERFLRGVNNQDFVFDKLFSDVTNFNIDEFWEYDPDRAFSSIISNILVNNVN